MVTSLAKKKKKYSHFISLSFHIEDNAKFKFGVVDIWLDWMLVLSMFVW
jgi:hypothetical protein